ncbi:hypothetical protein [Winogradskyella sp. 3972H.M.0a.05]|uniref:hypothetical protein n=1 Tax=Winogradskyella sp. 3972H.M.0a.05 TaxID=2950277 RepID=UPI00339A1A70
MRKPIYNILFIEYLRIMKTKTLALIIIAFMFLQCKKKSETVELPEEDCISLILKKDDSLGTIRNHQSEKISLSETINAYVKAMKLMDFSTCPDDFRVAFEDHITAWDKMTLVTNNYPNLRGEMHTLFDKIKKSKNAEEFKQRLDEIWGTWEKVEKAKE